MRERGKEGGREGREVRSRSPRPSMPLLPPGGIWGMTARIRSTERACTNLEEGIRPQIKRLLPTTVHRHLPIGLTAVALVPDDDDGRSVLSLHALCVEDAVEDVGYPTEGW